jgi:hypothetical protein
MDGWGGLDGPMASVTEVNYRVYSWAMGPSTPRLDDSSGAPRRVPLLACQQCIAASVSPANPALAAFSA